MEKDNYYPLEVGQLAEARSFMKGFRGAWFRCKIADIKLRNGEVYNVLHYLDFPDEKHVWRKLYQIPPRNRKQGTEMKRQIMVRPPLPPINRKSQMCPVTAITDVMVITEGIWNVGDLVDWWKDGCYWSGKVAQVLGNEKAMVELLPPPMGEGWSYEASFSDLRPSLDWSPEDGWTLPTPEDGGNYRKCAQLIHPVNQSAGGRLALEMPTQGEGTMEDQVSAGLSCAPPLSSHLATNSLAASENLKTCGVSEMLKESPSLHKEMMTIQENNNLVPEDSGSRKRSSSDSSYPRDGSTETVGRSMGEDLSDFCSPQKELRTSWGISLNSARSNTLEAAILDFEEFANKIKWLKGILKVEFPLSNAVKPSWKFVEHRGSSKPK
ncbi:hypothetical protein ACH5RR_031447 [Cinchona calisaya]|uniref:Agenet domain-containing protein n=1 Tax=Cinchona calisaya TaxID=153742 RepID=A0ABD2YJJ8_9GENT